MDILGLLLLIAGGVVGIAWLVGIVYAIVRTVTDPQIGGVLKLLWVIALFAFPVLGLLVWLLAHDQINGSLARSA